MSLSKFCVCVALACGSLTLAGCKAEDAPPVDTGATTTETEMGTEVPPPVDTTEPAAEPMEPAGEPLGSG